MAFLGPTKDKSAPGGTRAAALRKLIRASGLLLRSSRVRSGWAVAIRMLPPDAVVPAVSTLVLCFAALFGAIAWRRGRMDPANVTYADVAGALTLIGLFAAATIEPEQLVRLVGDGSK